MKNAVFGGVPEHFNIPLYYGLEKGLLNTFPATWKAYPGGTGAMLQDFSDGKLQIATLLTEGAIAGILAGVPAQIVKFYVDSPLIWGIHTRAGAGIRYPELQGRRYAISRFLSGSHLMPKVLAKQLDLEIREEDFVIVKNLDGAREALRDKQADLFFWEKYITMPYVQNGEFERIGECPTPWPSFCIVVHNNFVKETGYDTLRRFFAELHTVTWSLEKSGTLIEWVAGEFGLGHFDAARWYAEVEWNKKFGVDTEILKATLNRLQQIGLVPEGPGEELIRRLVHPDAVKDTNYIIPSLK